MNLINVTTKAIEETGNPWPVFGILAGFLAILATGLVLHLNGDKHRDDDH